MANDLKILVTASLNTGKSIGEINTAITGLEKKVKALKLNIEVNDKVLSTLNKFTDQMKKISAAALNTGKVIEEAINPDGSRTKRTYYDGLKGEFSEISRAAKKASQDQMKSLEEVEGSYNKVIKTVERLNAAQKSVGKSVTLADGNNTRTVNLNNKDQVTGYTDTTNTAKDVQDTQKLIAAKEKLRQELVKLGETGNVTAQQLANVARSVNGVKDTSGIKQAQLAYAQLADQAKLAEQMAQGRERGAVARVQAEQKLATAQVQAAGRNAELTRQEIQQGKELEAEIKRRLELYQREKQIQASNLQTRVGGAINQSALNSQLSSVMGAKPSDFKSLAELRNYTQQANAGFKELSAGIQNASHHALTLGDALKTAFSSFGIWMVSGTALMQSLNFFKDGIGFVNELNKSLTEISIVTGQSQKQVNALGDSYNKLAQQMGVTTNEIASTEAALYRQGLSAEETGKRMKTVIEYAKISSLDINTASEIMTAAINSMGVSGTKAADIWSYMGDATATGADEIGKAMQKVGGTAHSLQIPFEKVSSWIATLSSRTREAPETIGQSIKSILARVQSLKEKGFDETDGTKINNVAKALDSVGIKLVDSKGQFRNFSTVLDELGGKWTGLDNRQKAYLATTVAGTYQQSKFLNLMEGYGDSVNLYKDSLDSAGIAQQKFNLYQQGTEAQLNKLKATWEGVWMASFKSNDIQMFIGGLNGIATSVKFVISQFGLLAPALAIGSMAFIGFNSKAKAALVALNTNVITSIVEFGVFNKTLLTTGEMALVSSGNMGILSKTMLNLRLTARATGIAVGFLGNAMKAVTGFLLTTALPVAAIMAVGYGIQKLTEYMSKQRAEEAQLKSQQNSLISSYSKHKDEVSKLADEYTTLSNAKNNGGLNADEDKRYIEVQNKLAKILPTISAGFDAKGNSIVKSSSAIKEQITLLEKQTKLQKEQQKIDAPQKLADSGSKISDLQDEADKQNKIADSFKGQVKSLEDGKVKHSQILYVMGQENEAALKGANAQNQINAQQQKNAELIKGYFSKSNINSTGITEVSSILSEISLKGKDMGDVDLLFKSLAKNVNNFNSAFKSGKVAEIQKVRDSLRQLGLSEKQLDVIARLLTDQQIENTKVTKDASQAQKDYAVELQQTIDAEMAKATSEEQIIGTTQKLIDRSKDLITTYQLLSNMENLSVDQKAQLADATAQLSAMYPQFIQNGKLNVEQMRKEAESEDILLKAVTDVANGHANAEQIMTTNQALQSKARMQMMSAEIAAYEKMMLAIEATYEETGMSGAKSAAYHNASSKIGDLKSQIDSLTSSYQVQVQKLADATGYQGQFYNAVDKSKDASSNSIYVTDKYKQSLEALNAQISTLENLQKKYSTDSSQYRSALSKEITLLTQKKKLMDDQAKALAAQIKSGNVLATGMIKTDSSSSYSPSTSTKSSSGTYGGKYASYINQAASKYGVDPFLIAAIIQQESGFNPNAHSGAGAKGLMQLMPGTARSLGVSNAYDPLQSIMGGTSYIAQQLKSFGGNISKALAAYNAGPGNVRKYGGIPPFAETQKYVKSILAHYNGGGSSSSSSSSSGSTSAADKAQAIDQAKSDLVQLQLDANGIADQIEAIKIAIVQSKIDEVTNTASNKLNYFDQTIKQFQLIQSRYKEGSKEWNAEAQKQINLTKSKQTVTANEISALQKLLITEKLSTDQKSEINAKIKELTTTQLEYLNSIDDLDTKIRELAVNAKIESTNKLYDAAIAKLQKQLDLMDAQEKTQDRIAEKKKIQDEIDKVKSDKRFEYVDINGNIQLTYDKAKVAELEQQKKDLQAQYDKEDKRDAILAQIAQLEKDKTSAVDKLTTLLQTYADKSFQSTSDLQKIMNQFITELDKTYKTGTLPITKHHDGGIVGTISSSASQFVNKLFNAKPNEQIAKLLKGEVVINPMLPNVKSNIQAMQNLIANGKQQLGTFDQSRTIHLNNVTIRANNPMELFEGIDTLIRSQG